jgi:signal transduction histidine kinase
VNAPNRSVPLESAVLRQVAHDLNNALTAIKGYAQLIRAAGDGSRSSVDAGEILKSTDAAVELTRQLLALSRRTTMG